MIPMDRMEPQWWLQWWLHENMWFFLKLHKFSKHVVTVRPCLGFYLNNIKRAENMREKKMKIFWKIISPEKQTYAEASSYSVNSIFFKWWFDWKCGATIGIELLHEKKKPEKKLLKFFSSTKTTKGLNFYIWKNDLSFLGLLYKILQLFCIKADLIMQLLPHLR